jgi:hypothetical protein
MSGKGRDKMRFPTTAAALTAATLAAFAAPAAAAKLYLHPLPLSMSTEIVVGLVNTCAGKASFKLTIYDGLSNTLLKRKGGKIPAGAGKVVTYHPTDQDRDAVFGTLKLSCASEATPLPLVGVTIRDFATKVPLQFGCFIGDSLDGNCI